MFQESSPKPEEIRAAIQRRDRVLKELIKHENSVAKYNGRVENLRKMQADESLSSEKRSKAERLANHFDKKRSDNNKLHKGQEVKILEQEVKIPPLRDRHAAAQKELEGLLSQVKDPKAKHELRKAARDSQIEVHLREAGVKSTPLARENMRTTIVFMERKKHSVNEIQEFVNGSDFSKPVKIERLDVGTEKTQSVRIQPKDPNSDSNQTQAKQQELKWGDYHSEPGTHPDRVGVSTTNRETRRSQVQKPIYGLTSTSKPINDSWTDKTVATPTRGGAKQTVIGKEDQKHLKDITDDYKKRTPTQKHPSVAQPAPVAPQPAPVASQPKPIPQTQPKAASPAASNVSLPQNQKRPSVPQQQQVKAERVIQRKGAGSDIAVKNGRGTRIPKQKHSAPKHKR